MDDYQLDQQDQLDQKGEAAAPQAPVDLIDLIPTFEGGKAVAIGDRVRLDDGSLMRVHSVVMTAAGAMVSDQDFAAGKLGLVPVSHEVASAEADSWEELDADCLLTPDKYCQRRALEPEGGKPADKIRAMVADVRERQVALDRA